MVEGSEHYACCLVDHLEKCPGAPATWREHLVLVIRLEVLLLNRLDRLFSEDSALSPTVRQHLLARVASRCFGQTSDDSFAKESPHDEGDHSASAWRERFRQ